LSWTVLLPAATALAASPETRPSISSRPSSGSRPEGNSRVVATFMGREIRLAEIDLPDDEKRQLREKPGDEDAERRVRDRRVSQLSRKIVVPLRDQYIRENHLEPTREELAEAAKAFRARQESYRERQMEERRQLEGRIGSGELSDNERKLAERRLEGINRWLRIEDDAEKRRADSLKDLEEFRAKREAVRVRLESKDLGQKERELLSKELGQLDRVIELTGRLCKDVSESLADMMVGSWKFQRSLYRRYGGTVIYQQLGIEAVGAMRRWLEEHESAGRFAILDPQLREDFWYYYVRQDHPSKATAADPFKVPPWLEDAAASGPMAR
jgi:hypothetical protein